MICTFVTFAKGNENKQKYKLFPPFLFYRSSYWLIPDYLGPRTIGRPYTSSRYPVLASY